MEPTKATYWYDGPSSNCVLISITALKKWNIGFSLFAEGRRYDDLANTRELEGYATVDFRAGVQINKTLRIQAKIGNLFDKEYETAQLFNQDGRNYFFTLRFSPGKE